MSPSPVVLKLADAAAVARAQLRGGEGDALCHGVAPLEIAAPGTISFFANPAYRKHLAACRATAILVAPEHVALPELADRCLLLTSQPYAAFARLAQRFHPARLASPGVHASAVVEVGAVVDPTAEIQALAFIGAGARIGPRTVVMSGASVGENAAIGADSILYPNSTVRDGCLVGDRCIVHSGAVVGADGFGFAFDADGDGAGPVHRKIPQAGIARLEDDVELGANSCVDRATMGETVVGRGTKIDNLVQIAHNVQTGPLCLFAAQVGIAGSTKIGTGVSFGGQSGVAGHLAIGDLAKIGAQAGIARDVPVSSSLIGSPAVPMKQFWRAVVATDRLPDLLKEVRRLTARIDELEKHAGKG